MAASTAGEIMARPQAMGIPSYAVDGMDVRATRRTALEVFAAVRDGGGPVFVEARTYRFVGHSRSDPGRYRPEGELAQWQARDPLELSRAWLAEHLENGAERTASVDSEVAELLATCEANALAAPFPTPAPRSEFKS